jgi:Na+-translocating membrane potential-generating system (MpsC)
MSLSSGAWASWTAAEQQLVNSLAAEKARDLLKQARTHLIETARPVMESMVEEATGVSVLSVPPRHQHRNRRGDRVVHPGRIASVS